MRKCKCFIFVILLFILLNVPINASNQYVILGGDSVAIVLRYNGVLVTGRFPFEYEDKNLNPSSFEVKQNDIIVAVNNQSIYSIIDFYEELGNFKQPYSVVPITVSRKQKLIEVNIFVSYNDSNDMYKTGLYLKDELNGVGTLTYYNPSNHTFAALGHNIVNQSQANYVNQKGSLFYSSISSYSKSNINHIGEKYASICSNEIGIITKSNNYGVYGNYTIDVSSKPIIETANKKEVKIKEAFIYTVLEGTKIDKFSIQITEIHPNSQSKEKGITFKITDKRLLEATGGIIQGMSGSPIIQNGKLIGAVTHVLVNDPTRGYGIFIENMLDAAG